MTNYMRILRAVETIFGKGWDEESLSYFWQSHIDDDCQNCPVGMAECDKRMKKLFGRYDEPGECAKILCDWLKSEAKPSDPIVLLLYSNEEVKK